MRIIILLPFPKRIFSTSGIEAKLTDCIFLA
jgi:hypothetical protein